MEEKLFQNKWLGISLRWQQVKLTQIPHTEWFGVFNLLLIICTEEKKLLFFPSNLCITRFCVNVFKLQNLTSLCAWLAWMGLLGLTLPHLTIEHRSACAEQKELSSFLDYVDGWAGGGLETI